MYFWVLLPFLESGFVGSQAKSGLSIECWEKISSPTAQSTTFDGKLLQLSASVAVDLFTYRIPEAACTQQLSASVIGGASSMIKSCATLTLNSLSIVYYRFYG
jgi:hypothetical protein